MTRSAEFDAWKVAQNYEEYMGRWSRQIAATFVHWLAPPQGADWLELGCGTGALTATILAQCAPGSIVAIDPSKDFVAYARSRIDDERARFEIADAQDIPAADASIDIVASGLVLNFLADRTSALAEARRVLKPGGLLSFYVWDYPAGGVGFIDVFWKAAAECDDRARTLNEAGRFPFCTPDGLRQLCRDAGLREVVVDPIEIETVFPDFEAFWHPFTLGAGPAPGYCASLNEQQREMLKAHLQHSLGTRPIRLSARAWAVKAVRSA